MSDTRVSRSVLAACAALDVSPEQFDELIDRLLDPNTPRKPIGRMPSFCAVYDPVIGLAFAVKTGAAPLVCTWFEFRALARGKVGTVGPGLRN